MRTGILCGVSVLALTMAAPAWSQTTPAQTTPAQTSVEVEELIVTAQKREERSLEVPMAVSAVP